MLGARIEVEGLDLADDQAVLLTLRYRLGTTTATTVGRGETIIAAHTTQRESLVVDRLTLGYRALTEEVGAPRG